MDRQQIANAILRPLDRAVELGLQGVARAGVLDPASDLVYRGLRGLLGANFRLRNDLEVTGAENVPAEGGVLLASNHQSWLDVQVLGVACPRRVHFIAKTEFETWPVLRNLVALSESVFVRRGGDDAALAAIAEALRGGWAVAIYPEGTIPGEEEIPRVAVDPQTGLLPGHTGVARLALKAGVPIVPVGVSGTGRAFPPEIYPRLEILRMPGATPIRIRFGRPISPDEVRDRREPRRAYRELTDRVMREISALVDHRANYVPMEVPLRAPPRREVIGVLCLHGFTSHLNTVNGLVPWLEEAGVPYEMPILRGHGTRFQDLRGVTARDWYVDAERALISLWNWADRVVVVGLSMGGLVALELTMRHPDKIAGVVTAAAPVRWVDPLARLTPLIARVARTWPSPESFNDPSLKVRCKNYPRFPTDAFLSLYRYTSHIAGRLGEVHVPIRILQSKKDQIVAPESANIIYEKVSSPHREIVWYQRSGHEMMQDLEAEAVFKDIMEFVHRFEESPRLGPRFEAALAAAPSAAASSSPPAATGG